MKTLRMTIDVQNPIAKPVGRIDAARVDATNEADIAKHKAAEVDRVVGSLQIDSSFTRETLGWTPPVSVAEGIRRMVQG